MKEQIEHYWKIYQTANDWIKFSDTKAGIILTLYGVILTLIYTNSDKVYEAISMSGFLIFFSTTSALCAMTSVIFAFRCLNPSLKNINPTSIIYFGHIAQFKSFTEYQSFSFPIISDETEFLKQLNEQIFINSKIAQRKFENTAWAVRFFFGSNILLVLSLIKYLF